MRSVSKILFWAIFCAIVTANQISRGTILFHLKDKNGQYHSALTVEVDHDAGSKVTLGDILKEFKSALLKRGYEFKGVMVWGGKVITEGDKREFDKFSISPPLTGYVVSLADIAIQNLSTALQTLSENA